MGPEPSSCLVLEYDPSGHHLFYVRLRVEGLVERGVQPVVATSQTALDSGEWQLHLRQWEDCFDVRVGRGDELTLTELCRVAAASGQDLAVVPHGDQLAATGIALARLRGRRVRLLIMRDRAIVPRFPLLSPIKTMLKKIQLRAAAIVPGIELVQLRPSTDPGVAAGRIARDPVEFERNPAAIDSVRSRLRSSGSPHHWVAVLGAITRRKNVALLSEAMRRLPTESVGLVIAGRVLDESTQEVRDAASSLIAAGYGVLVDDRDLPDADLDAYVAVADVVVLAHSNEGPSGLLGKCLAAGTSVLAAGAASPRTDVARRPEAAAWVPLESGALADGLIDAFKRHPAPARDLGSRQFVSALLDDPAGA